MPTNKLESVLSAVKVLRSLDPDMPIAQAQCLLLIASHEGLSLKELAARAGVGMASASRYVAAFSKSVGDRKGLGLVVAVEDPLERRKKTITLTSKGRIVINQIAGE